MSAMKAAQKWPSVSAVKSVAAGQTETPQPKQTLDPRPSFSPKNDVWNGAPASSGLAGIASAGNVGGTGKI